jgi:hypothetical protein
MKVGTGNGAIQVVGAALTLVLLTACHDDPVLSFSMPESGPLPVDAAHPDAAPPSMDASPRHSPDATVPVMDAAKAPPDHDAEKDASRADSGEAGMPDAMAQGETGAPVPPCSAPVDPAHAKACLVFTPETVRFESDATLDGNGTLVLRIFGTPDPSQAPLAGAALPPLPDGGVGEMNVASLPQLDFEGLPDTVYIYAVFVDNPAWFLDTSGLTYGTFVGGLNLGSGLSPRPAIKPVALKKGAGTLVPIFMTAMRRFTSTVEVALPDGGGPEGDGQGPLSVGVFQQASPAGAQVFGSATLPCVDSHALPVAVSGFFYGSGANWFAAQIDDFGVGTAAPAGALVSLVPPLNIPEAQKLTVADDAYSVSIPRLQLTTVLPGDPMKPDFHCPLGP